MTFAKFSTTSTDASSTTTTPQSQTTQTQQNTTQSVPSQQATTQASTEMKDSSDTKENLVGDDGKIKIVS